uniref:Uncharacterized protein n=1 Tax=Romanomermis culicivorax TaxID=13658 RepID=A0A915I9D5_ROMCU
MDIRPRWTENYPLILEQSAVYPKMWAYNACILDFNIEILKYKVSSLEIKINNQEDDSIFELNFQSCLIIIIIIIDDSFHFRNGAQG